VGDRDGLRPRPHQPPRGLRDLYGDRPPERIVQEHQWRLPDGGASPRTVVTVLFQEQGKHTRLTLTQAGFDSVEARDGHGEGWGSTLDRLAVLAEGGA
jgi:uncharacterized protein YndB with AHSA1/START domain